MMLRHVRSRLYPLLFDAVFYQAKGWQAVVSESTCIVLLYVISKGSYRAHQRAQSVHVLCISVLPCTFHCYHAALYCPAFDQRWLASGLAASGETRWLKMFGACLSGVGNQSDVSHGDAAAVSDQVSKIQSAEPDCLLQGDDWKLHAHKAVLKGMQHPSVLCQACAMCSSL